MSEAEDVEVVASGFALSQVSQWLGVCAEDVLNETDAATDALFDKPRPSLLGLGAKFVSHKSMEQSGLEHKLKQRLRKSADGSSAAAVAAGYQPAQLDRFMQQRGKRRHGGDGQGQQQAQQHDSSDEEDGGKLYALQQNKKQHQQQHTGGSSKGQQQQQQQQQQQLGRKQFVDI
ncbi:hypothetical protein OEZ85_005533 [Tetradesmus obliquus]|uniref:Uncharacterized protein n=1 Tax=Tetradesmus obliquus TaxID=3088 RepID=A0ABY8UEW1_TETOB|nr:hypothetical protein OEZ85_005533 [Tetradesmus obliquus]